MSTIFLLSQQPVSLTAFHDKVCLAALVCLNVFRHQFAG